MLNLEFIGYVATPGEKHLGIASIRVDKRFVFRFKIAVKKDGGHFPAAASYKIADASGDRYTEAFLFDSRTDDQMVKDFIMAEVKKAQQKATPSVFSTTSTGQSLDKTEQQEEEMLPF